MIKIIVPICNRTNYSKLKPIIQNLVKRDNVFVSVVLSSGMLVSKYGSFKSDVLSFGVKNVYEIDCLLMNDSAEGMSKTAGLSIIEHSSLYAKEKPDAVLVVGDRFDMVSPVLAAKIMNIKIIHIQGGEKSGSIDDTVRDIISVCSDYHFVATDKALDNVKRITCSEFVYNYGCPAVEYVSHVNVGEFLDVNSFHKDMLFKKNFEIKKGEKFFLLVVHPNTTKPNDVNMEVILKTVLSFGLKVVVFYPNFDAFNHFIVDEIRRNSSKLICVKHLEIEDFVKIMSHCTCMIGNSSAGIRESASFGIPFINIGDRQSHRERNDNTFDVECVEEQIKTTIKEHYMKKFNKNNIYYKNGCTVSICDKICQLLQC